MKDKNIFFRPRWNTLKGCPLSGFPLGKQDLSRLNRSTNAFNGTGRIFRIHFVVLSQFPDETEKNNPLARRGNTLFMPKWGRDRSEERRGHGEKFLLASRG